MNFRLIKLSIFCFCLIYLFNFKYSFADDVETELIDSNTIETYANSSSDLNINAKSYIILDRLSKNVLFGKNQYNKVKMASTTKIMTATIIIENCDLDQTVDISRKAASTGGSRLGLKAGDKITIRDLLYGLMLCSGNDAAVALAETCSGNIKEFSDLMNEKAKELGLNNSHFDSPHGLDSDEHYTTAYELALLSDYALKSKIFLDIVGTKNHTISINGSPKNLSNTNELLGNLLGIYGIKTGFTNGANRCLVTACKRDDMDIICVVLGCDTKKFRTQDSIKLIEYAFKNFEYVNIKEKIDTEFEKWKQENKSNFYIYKGVNSNLSLKYDNLENSIIPIKKENISSLKIYININSYLSAPIAENTVIGKIEVVTNNSSKSIAINVLSSNSISKKSFSNYLLEFLKSYSSRLSSIISTNL